MIFQFILKVLEKTEVKALCMSVKFFNTEMCNVAQQWEWAQRLILGCFINMIQSKDKPVVTTFESTLTLYNTMLHNCTMLHFIFHSIIKFKVFNIVLKLLLFFLSICITYTFLHSINTLQVLQPTYQHHEKYSSSNTDCSKVGHKSWGLLISGNIITLMLITLNSSYIMLLEQQ